jgi:hypothetical protein
MTETTARDADAVRYAVLRKLASGMRHALVSELQTIQFTAELAARMQGTGVTDARLAECLQRMGEQTRAAIDSARALTEWLRPDDNATSTVGEALQQCLRLAGDDWSLRGIEASTDVRTGPVLVAKAALRELLVTSLVALVDTHPGAIDIEVAAESAGANVIVSLQAKRADRKSPFPPLSIHRTVTGEDVVTVGRAHGVACTCKDGAVTLRLPKVFAAA